MKRAHWRIVANSQSPMDTERAVARIMQSNLTTIEKDQVVLFILQDPSRCSIIVVLSDEQLNSVLRAYIERMYYLSSFFQCMLLINKKECRAQERARASSIETVLASFFGYVRAFHSRQLGHSSYQQAPKVSSSQHEVC